MDHKRIAGYGTWESPVSAAQVAAAGVSFTAVMAADGALYWVEMRPAEQGRRVIVRRDAAGHVMDVTPPGFSAHSRVHEYGGGDYCVHAGVVYFSNSADQRVYRQPPGEAPRPITPEPPAPAALRYGDGRVTPDGRWLIAVRETHSPEGVVINDLVSIPTDGSGLPVSLASGYDFYAAPRLNPEGTRLCWLAWKFPQMPWDGTELWAAALGEDGLLHGARRIAGSRYESISQPEWSPSGELHYVSDISGWWNLYRAGDEDSLAPIEAECGLPAWALGLGRYAFLNDGRIAIVYSQDGLDRLGLIEPGSGRIAPLDVPFTSYYRAPLASDGRRLYAVAGAPDRALAVVRIDPVGAPAGSPDDAVEVLRDAGLPPLDPGYASHPEPITYPSADGRPAYALFYSPANRDFAAPPDELPPLIAIGHGGPTDQAPTHLRPEVQFWTSRGFAVVDVNYSGSSGYGRAYRDRLRGKWGVNDVIDTVAAVRALVARGQADRERLLVRGGSAGGYLALCALTFHDDFAAGASYYGISDLEVLAQTTHKFEARYMDLLVGPYPAARTDYLNRSPLYFADRIACPVIFFQGTEDRVVPPSQAEGLVNVLRGRGLPVEYLLFEGEGHGFQQAANLQRALEAELAFYTRVLGLGEE